MKNTTYLKTDNASTLFGQFIFKQRKAATRKAREVAAEAGMLPSNYSKIETGAMNPPKDPSKLNKLGKALRLRLEDDWTNFRDLAARANDTIASDLVEIIGRNNLLPRFLRTLQNKQITDVELEKIIEQIRKS